MPHDRMHWSLLALLVIALTSQQRATSAQDGALDTVTADELHALVDDRKGQVVVVNFWATWCPPCKAEFPDIVRFHDEHRDRGVAVIAVSMNDAEEADDVAAFLAAVAPSFPVYRAATLDETFWEGAVRDDEWFGELPITLIFDAAGNRAHYHRRPVTYDGLVEDVTPLLDAAR